MPSPSISLDLRQAWKKLSVSDITEQLSELGLTETWSNR